MWRDLHFGLRILRRHPSSACAAIAVMTLGVGATTAVFSVLRGVLIEPLPYRDPGQLVLFRADLPGVTQSPALTSMEFAAVRAQTGLFESVAAAVGADGNLTAANIMAPMNAAAVSENFLETLGVRPALGRAAGGVDAGARRSINISYEIWQRHFNGDAAIVGATIEVNGNPRVVAGVLPARIQDLPWPRRDAAVTDGSVLLPVIGLRRGSVSRECRDRAVAAWCGDRNRARRRRRDREAPCRRAPGSLPNGSGPPLARAARIPRSSARSDRRSWLPPAPFCWS